MSKRYAYRFNRGKETVAGGRRCDDRHRRVRVAPIHRLVQVRLLGLGRQSGGRPAALRIDDDERQLRVDGKTHRFGFQSNARAGTRRHTDGAAIGCADRGANRRNLVFRLKRTDTEVTTAREPVQ